VLSHVKNPYCLTHTSGSGDISGNSSHRQGKQNLDQLHII